MVTMSIIALGFLSLILVNLMLYSFLRSQIKTQFKELKSDYEIIKYEITELKSESRENFRTLSSRVDNVNTRIDTIFTTLFTNNKINRPQ